MHCVAHVHTFVSLGPCGMPPRKHRQESFTLGLDQGDSKRRIFKYSFYLL